jgi:hypothetical protein
MQKTVYKISGFEELDAFSGKLNNSLELENSVMEVHAACCSQEVVSFCWTINQYIIRWRSRVKMQKTKTQISCF